MFILLSSAQQPRYRQDVLRCLAAPLGSEIQFRYAKKHVAQNVIAMAEQHAQRRKAARCKWRTNKSLGDGLVCFVDNGVDGIAPLVPIRAASVTRINLHGTTISVTLRMGYFVDADSSAFTNEVSTWSENATPRRNEAKQSTGSYFLSLDKVPQHTMSIAVELWEQIVARLAGHPAFQSEPFFWTVLGIEGRTNAADSEQFHAWPKKVRGVGALILYHYRCEPGEVSPTSLDISAGGAIEPASPSAISVDSRYDLHRWHFASRPPTWCSESAWLRIASSQGWSLDLPLKVKGALLRTILTTIPIGAFIAGPPILTTLNNEAISSTDKLLFALFSFGMGLVAALTVAFGLPRVRS